MDTMSCRFFQSQQGCFRGDSCTFRHERAPGAAPLPHDDPNDPSSAALAAGIDSIRISASNPYANGGAAPSGARLCRFYAAATGCRNGPQCPFAHVAPPPIAGGGMMPYALDEQALDYANVMYYQSGMVPLPPVMPPMMLTDPPPPLPTTGMHVQIPSHGSHVHANGTSPMHDHGGASTPSSATISGGSSSANSTPRRPLKIQANPSKSGNYEVISEVLPVLTREIEGPVRRARSLSRVCC